jgi:lipopolysaccharide biosynthesis glycosyltransferase
LERTIFIGYDARETESFAVCRHTLRKFAPDIPIHAISLEEMRDAGLYWRPTSRRFNEKTGAEQLFDDISEHPMSTEFAISRFLAPVLAKSSFRPGWALFMDCDVLARDDIDDLFAEADPSKAVMCVQHNHQPTATTKMDGQVQSRYSRKNWSSVMLFNTQHPANRKLTVELINKVPGRDLHAFCWLDDHEIGALSPEWNYLVGYTKLSNAEPKLVHFTEGGPWFEAYRDVEFADEYRSARSAWLNEGMSTKPTARVSALTPRRPNGALLHAAGAGL